MKLQFLESLGRELRDTLLRLLRDYSEALIMALIMALVLRTFVVSAYRISNATMEPNLRLGDFVLGYKLPFGITIPLSDIRIGHGRPNPGDLVIFRCPTRPTQSCVKRVIALPGDRVDIFRQRLSVNGHRAKYQMSPSQFEAANSLNDDFIAFSETYGNGRSHEILVSKTKPSKNFGPFIVPPNTVFVLGDNRDYSEDSRHWGGIPVDSIEAKVVFVWLSIEWNLVAEDTYSSSVRWHRIFSIPD